MENSDMQQKFEKRAQGIREWLEKNARECFEEQKHTRAGTQEKVYWHYGYMAALTDILRLLPPPKWISVEERPPEITSHWGPGDFYGGSDCVLAFRAYSRQICTAVFYSSGAWTTTEGSKLLRVTHWQPLPALPLSTEAEKGKA